MKKLGKKVGNFFRKLWNGYDKVVDILCEKIGKNGMLVVYIVLLTGILYLFNKYNNYHYMRAMGVVLVIIFSGIISTLLGIDKNYNDKNTFFEIVGIFLMCIAIIILSIYGLLIFEPIVNWFLSFIGVSAKAYISDCVSVVLILIPSLSGIIIRRYREMKSKDDEIEKMIVEKERIGLKYEADGTESTVYKVIVTKKV